jgi:site-specific DNA-methyltransferase (adenine-specific)
VQFGTSKNETSPLGRFPSNVVLTYDETDFDEVCGGMPYTKSTGGSEETSKRSTLGNFEGGWKHEKDCAHLGGLGDEGSAARYFYCAKASKRDRDEGLDAVNITHYELLPDVPDEIVSKILQSLTSQC